MITKNKVGFFFSKKPMVALPFFVPRLGMNIPCLGMEKPCLGTAIPSLGTENGRL